MRKDNQNSSPFHWTDVAVENIIREKGNKEKYVLAAGITPSGVVHIGNFREIITVDLVKRALERKGKKVRFIYSWDDYDVFRKVPQGMPKPELLEKNIRKPIVKTPDTYGCHNNYAEHNQKAVEEAIPKVGIQPEFIYQHKKYQNGDYAAGIKTALENNDKIKEILNQYRKEPLSKAWLPISIFCPKCDKDTITKLEWKGDYDIYYQCACGQEETIDFRKKTFVKLKWRIDWPMRWNYEKVDFEPGGKDHSTAGGSYETGKKICKAVWNWDAPTYVMYNFISIKGGPGKMSSSSGNVIDLNDVLEIYEPELVRYLFAGTRANKEFNISFDTDVLKIYEDYDKCERIYFGEEKVNEKETEKQKRIYELSQIGKIPTMLPYQPGFRHLTTVLQINQLDVNKAVKYLEEQLKNDFDKKRLKTRTQCAKNWLHKYAPEDFKFTVQNKCLVTLAKEEKKILQQLAERLLEKEWTDVDLHEEIYVLCQGNNFSPPEFFKLVYKVLINKEKGPKLASFILEIGRERVAKLLKV